MLPVRLPPRQYCQVVQQVHFTPPCGEAPALSYFVRADCESKEDRDYVFAVVEGRVTISFLSIQGREMPVHDAGAP